MEPKKLIESYFDFLSKGDILQLFRLFSPNVKWHQPGRNKFSGTKNNLQELSAMLEAMMRDTAGCILIKRNGSLMVNGNTVAAPLVFSARNGKKNMGMLGTDLFRVEDDKIVEVWLFSEDQEMEDDFWNSK